MADHKHGSMDIKAHHGTFAGFIAIAKWTVILVIVTLIFMALVNG